MIMGTAQQLMGTAHAGAQTLDQKIAGPTVQNNLTPSLEMDKFCALDTFPHSGSGQAWLIKALCGLLKHSPGPVTLARGNWCDR